MGTFSRGLLVRAAAASLVATRTCPGGMLAPVMEAADSAQLHAASAGRFPGRGEAAATLPDPYEARLVRVAASEIPGAGRGLLAARALEADTVVAFYHGRKVAPEEFNPESWEGNCYKIFDPSDYPRGTIDIPAWAQVDTVHTVHCNIIASIPSLCRVRTATAPRSPTRPTTASSPTPSSWCSTIPSSG